MVYLFMTVNTTDLTWMPEAALSSKEEIPQTVPTLRKKLVHLPVNNGHRSQHLQKLHTLKCFKIYNWKSKVDLVCKFIRLNCLPVTSQTFTNMLLDKVLKQNSNK